MVINAMDDLEKKVREKLEKLKRNLTQMTEEQKERYLVPLGNLKLEIAAYVGQMTSEHWLLGYRFSKAKDPEDATAQIRCRKACNDILQTERAINISKHAHEVMLETYDLNEYFKVLEPLNEYIFFKAYAPYWLRHCKSEVLQGSDNTVFSYSNDLIDMKWDPEQRLWVGDSGQFAEMLPPTQ